MGFGMEIEMRETEIIREYVEDYVKYYSNRWTWKLKDDSIEQNELYMLTRARRSREMHLNNDLLPDFYSIEKDADQFGLSWVEWTDFFGLIWEGKKGGHAYVGAPDYKGSLYFYDPYDEYDEPGYKVSSNFDAYEHQPPGEIYTKITQRGINHWVDTKNVVDIRYKYVVENHLFKDTHIDLIYEDGGKVTVYTEYRDLVKGLLDHGKKTLVNKVFEAMNEHFIKLRDSDREEERKFYPGLTAEEMFLSDENVENKQRK